ncbi:GAF domain-containing sensor histidine kinase, partial [bacterium]|nr:GAF domain-containing sensor histidine kinase [bacterium]
YRAYKTSISPLEKNQYKYFFFGMIVALLLSLTNFMRVMGIRIHPLDHIGILFFNTMIAIAILKYRLMDISIIIRPGIIYTSLTLLITAIWLSVITFFENIFHFEALPSRILALVVIIFVFNLLRERVQLVVDRIFFRERQNLFELQERVSKKIASTLDPDQITPFAMKAIQQSVHPEFICLRLLSSDKKHYGVKSFLGEGEEKYLSLSVDNPLIGWFKSRKREIFKEEPEDNPYFGKAKEEIKETIEKIKARLVVPLMVGDDLLGVLSLGEKKGENKVYSFAEIGFLNTTSRELAIALKNTQLYADLKKRTEELERANEAKSEFLQIVSHELNTPLTIILGEINILKMELKKGILSKYKERLSKMEDKGIRLSHLIRDMLDMSSVERGVQLKIEKEVVNVEEIIEDVLTNFQSTAFHKEIRIGKDIQRGLSLVSDPKKIKDILSRLIDNALKYTPAKGSVLVGTRDAKESIEFFVQDTGMGIKKEDQEKIFERFFQADATITRKYSGTGMGLAVVKDLAAALEGEIRVESELNKGSRFIFTVKKKGP